MRQRTRCFRLENINFRKKSLILLYDLVNDNQYCIRITAGKTNTPACDSSYASSPVKVTQNGVELGTLANGFTQEDFCMSLDQVGPKNDIFELAVNPSDGVSLIKSD